MGKWGHDVAARILLFLYFRWELQEDSQYRREVIWLIFKRFILAAGGIADCRGFMMVIWTLILRLSQ